MQTKDILTFWFETLSPNDWFSKNDNLDKTITEKFSSIHKKASLGELFSWRKTMHGRLAEIIILDQFSRNMFRNLPEAFKYDSLALVLAQEASIQPSITELTLQEKAFLYMPFMHSESLLVHEEAVRLFSEKGLEFNLKFELEHKKVLEQFGRYPHRNAILNRQSTKEELAYLASDEQMKV